MFLSTAYLCSDLLVRPILTVSSRQHLHYFADASVLSHKPVPTGTDSSSFSLRSSAASLVSFPNEVSSVIILLDTSTIAKRQAGSGLPGSPAACQSECTGFTEVFNRCLDLDRSGCLQVCSIMVGTTYVCPFVAPVFLTPWETRPAVALIQNTPLTPQPTRLLAASTVIFSMRWSVLKSTRNSAALDRLASRMIPRRNWRSLVPMLRPTSLLF
jgi:hypothetical protein